MREKGMSLPEVFFCLLVVGILFFPIINGIGVAKRSIVFSEKRIEALGVAQEWLESLKNTDFDEIQATETKEGIYTIKTLVEGVGEDGKKVTLSVSWKEEDWEEGKVRIGAIFYRR
jgi:hypothetical protein